jgi:hypothetical protein
VVALLNAPGALRSLATRLALVSLAAIVLCAALASGRADAVVLGEFGVQTRAPVVVNSKTPLQYHGGPVVPASDTYAI